MGNGRVSAVGSWPSLPVAGVASNDAAREAPFTNKQFSTDWRAPTLLPKLSL